MLEAQNRYMIDFKRTQEELTIIQKSILDKVTVMKAELIRSHVERSKNSKIFFRNLMDSIENIINDTNEIEHTNEEDMDLMIVPNEDHNHGKTQINHKATCIYYEENKSLSNTGGFQTVKPSPDKKQVNFQQKENKFNLLDNINDMSMSQEKQDSLTRNRSYSDHITTSPLKQKDKVVDLQQSNCNLNFGHQINIYNNYASQSDSG